MIDASELWEGPRDGFGPDAETDLLLALRRGAAAVAAARAAAGRALPDVARARRRRGDRPVRSARHRSGRCRGRGAGPVGAHAHRSRPDAHVEPPPGAGRRAGPLRPRHRVRAAVAGRRSTASRSTRASCRPSPQSRRPLVRLRGEWVVVDPTGSWPSSAGATRCRRADALVAALSGTAAIDGEVVAVDVGGAGGRPGRGALRSAADAPRADRTAGARRDAAALPAARPGLDGRDGRPRPRRRARRRHGPGQDHPADRPAPAPHRARRVRRSRRSWSARPRSSATGSASSRRFAPGLPVHRYHGADRDLADSAPHDVVSPPTGSSAATRRCSAEQPWGLVVADEAQQIKNPNSAVAKAMRTVPAGARLALTGTPVENRLTELWSLLDWTTPGLLGGVEAFRRNVAIPIERDRDAEATTSASPASCRPFLLRRRKDDPDGRARPAAQDRDRPPGHAHRRAGRPLPRPSSRRSSSRSSKAEGIARRGLVLKLLTALKQICNHPAHYLGQPGPLAGRSGKLDAFDDLVAGHRRRRATRRWSSPSTWRWATC